MAMINPRDQQTWYQGEKGLYRFNGRRDVENGLVNQIATLGETNLTLRAFSPSWIPAAERISSRATGICA